ncbi:uncharacterized protein BJ171DRAFT_600666 [Polychytrium aggregatum]|uniref:uncharacterized protein n=1 Tax=Polychytrium aggregatum TaxID=110093 RepID=UPI0022FF02B1|nr:uncharacterized protein BJ171DRAFT_600666 [Polychytrium aggregatum]KAI9202652.1 hypothetical protein BJ171DRAFT_600666 [Polychytrium aggregatum]
MRRRRAYLARKASQRDEDQSPTQPGSAEMHDGAVPIGHPRESLVPLNPHGLSEDIDATEARSYDGYSPPQNEGYGLEKVPTEAPFEPRGSSHAQGKSLSMQISPAMNPPLLDTLVDVRPRSPEHEEKIRLSLYQGSGPDEAASATCGKVVSGERSWQPEVSGAGANHDARPAVPLSQIPAARIDPGFPASCAGDRVGASGGSRDSHSRHPGARVSNQAIPQTSFVVSLANPASQWPPQPALGSGTDEPPPYETVSRQREIRSVISPNRSQVDSDMALRPFEQVAVLAEYGDGRLLIENQKGQRGVVSTSCLQPRLPNLGNEADEASNRL